MLKSLNLRQVGPIPEVAMDLAPRLNVLVGDNGLGKTFLLDVAWWVLTRTWANEAAWPNRSGQASIRAKASDKSKDSQVQAVFDAARQEWRRKSGRPAMQGVTIYARVDGGFSVWDPARNDWRDDEPDRLAAFSFTKREVWDGLRLPDGTVQSKGLIQDWVEWQLSHDPAFDQLTRVLRHLSPRDAAEELRPGEPIAISAEDVRDVPTIELPYGTIPLQFASAGVRRIVALAYLLVWAWRQHCRAAKLRDQQPDSRFVLVIDEIEAHLHPKWQRSILPALLDVVHVLEGGDQLEVQLLVATHSPMVLASLEPHFDQQTDRLLERVLPGHDPFWPRWLVSAEAQLVG